MRRARHRALLAGALRCLCLATVGCGSSDRRGARGSGGGPGSGSGGAGAGGSPAGTGGSIGSGGASANSGGAGGAGASPGGMAATGGRPAGAAGTAGGGDQGGAGAGSAAGAGAAGAGMGGAGGSAKAAAAPSTGCGQLSPETGTAASPLVVSDHRYYVKLPANYDPARPYPLLFVFNGTGDRIDWAEIHSALDSVAKGAIRVYPHYSNSGWGAGDVPFFMALYDQITSRFCVDKVRVFAAGSDSGGTFASILGCEYASVLRGVAPSGTREPRVGSPDAVYPLDATMRTCTGQVAAVVVHGLRDQVVGPEHGLKTRDFYRTLNHCGTETTPVPAQSVSNCVQYLGCDEGFPVYFCQHTDPTYASSNHGWPSWASSVSWKLFSSY